MKRGATIAFDGLCRLDLSRVWDETRPLAAWLLTNPSTADAEEDDPTAKRMRHFSTLVGCGGFVAVNYRPWRTPYPAELWRALRAGKITPAMMDANDVAIVVASARARFHFVAFGVEPPRRDRDGLERALDMFAGSRSFDLPLLCLGVSDDGWPLHPLARGKFAIRNDRQPMPWSRPRV
jgi:hypothetical protein